MKLFVTTLLALLLTIPNSLHAGSNIWDDIKVKTSELGKKSIELMSKSDEETTEDKINEIKNHATNYADLKYKKDNAPRKAFFGKTKEDYDAEITEILEEVEEILFDGEMTDYSKKIRSKREKIKDIKDEIAFLNEKSVMAKANNNESKVKKIVEKIAKLEDDEKSIEINILEIEGKIRDKFQSLGVPMSREQIQTLIMRIDGDDLIKSITMYEVLKKILSTTRDLMATNKDNMEYVKKYYGVYVLLSQTVVYAQTKYIEKNKGIWSVKLKTLKIQANNVIEKTKNTINEISDARRMNILKKNIDSNLFTIKVIDLYRQQLQRQRKKIELARKESLKDVKVAWSSYETAALSADLIDNINQADKAFESVIQMEIPEIVVFENEAVRNKYADLTENLSIN